MTGRRLVLVAFTLLLASCAVAPKLAPPPRSIVLVDPELPIDGAWQHGVFGRATLYSRVALDGRWAIRAEGRESASGLYRWVRFDAAACPWVEWSWRVERLQPGADIRLREGDDVAASLFFLFGDPGLERKRVPTLRYVWTNGRVAKNSVLDNPFHPGTVRVVVVRSGDAGLGRWVSERRNLAEDFARAFGGAPPAEVEMFALFADNDQTAEPVEAYYGPARVDCGT